MNLEELQKSGWIVFSVTTGSHAYGTNIETSDVDTKGFYMLPDEAYLALEDPEPQISDDTNDVTYYSLKRAFELLSNANPNLIELLWTPEDCIQIKKSPCMDLLLSNRNLFISKKCLASHSKYAFAQIKKAKGSNKKVHNPMPKTMPKKEDFCWVIRDFKGHADWDDASKMIFPCRPVRLSETEIDLKYYHASSLEHSHNIFRLYNYGKRSKGVFRGDDMLVCESIPKDDEVPHFSYLMIYNVDEYNKALKDWHSYWDWMSSRNESRWIDQENGKLDYDQKNLMHCVRNLMSGENILLKGEPLVRFTGEKLKYLMKIRKGECSYEELMEDAERRMEYLNSLEEKSDLPENVDREKIANLYNEIMKSN